MSKNSNSDGFTIRPAIPTDRDTIVEFNLRLALETENNSLDRDTVTAGVEALLRDPTKGRYFVAERAGEVIGQLMHTREWSDWRNGDLWWIQSVFVAADFRRQGIFRALYHHLEKLARETTGVVGLRLYVETENSTAQNTYQRLGMTSPGYFVMESLDST